MDNLHTGQPRRILVIDDNRSIHEDFRKILGSRRLANTGLDEAEAELFGSAAATDSAPALEIDSAYQGQEAVALVQTALEQGRPYAMAFVDVRMPPGMDGRRVVCCFEISLSLPSKLFGTFSRGLIRVSILIDDLRIHRRNRCRSRRDPDQRPARAFPACHDARGTTGTNRDDSHALAHERARPPCIQGARSATHTRTTTPARLCGAPWSTA